MDVRLFINTITGLHNVFYLFAYIFLKVDSISIEFLQNCHFAWNGDFKQLTSNQIYLKNFKYSNAFPSLTMSQAEPLEITQKCMYKTIFLTVEMTNRRTQISD